MTSGEYDGYGGNGLYQAKQAFEAHEQLQKWAGETGRIINVEGWVPRDYENEKSDFLKWLLSKNLIEEVEYREMHTGCYSDTDLRANF